MPKLGLGLSLPQTRKGTGVNVAITNRNFSNLTGLTLTDPVNGWYSGVPFGWNSENTSGNTYSVRSTDGVFYANLQQLSNSSPFQRFYQDLVGTLPVSTTANLTLKACMFTVGLDGLLGFAFYNSTNNDLIASGSSNIPWFTATPSSPKTVSFTTTAPAETPIRLALWTANAVGITDISINLY